MRVDVYFNLHKKKLSIKAREDFQVGVTLVKTGRVFHHRKGIVLKDVSFVVSKAGRERVLREKKKNVHAYIRGDFDVDAGYAHAFSETGQLKEACDAKGEQIASGATLVRVTYNPYLYDSFVNAQDTFCKIVGAEEVYVIGKDIWAKNPVFA